MPDHNRAADPPSDGDRDPADPLDHATAGSRAERMADLGRSIAEIKAGRGIPVEDVLAEMRRVLAEARIQ